ncbi:MAG: tetratricopeptide repeat protein [Gemmatimonadales bacterium]
MAVARAAILVALLLAASGSASAQNEGSAELRLELRRIEALERSGELTAAAMALEDMLRRVPAHPGAILAYERVSRRLGQLDRVIPIASRAVARDPESGLLRQVELRVLAELGDRDGLREAGRRWLESAPKSDSAYREYAAALRRLGAVAEAEQVLREGARTSERPIAMAVELANLYQDQERWSEAAEQWVIVIRSSPNLGWDFINFKLRAMGPVEASRAAEALLQRIPDSRGEPQELKLAAIAALYAGAAEEAQRRAESLVVDLEPRERQAFINDFAQVAASRAQPALVAWAYRQLLREVPDETARWDLARQIVQNDLTAGDTTSALRILDGLLDDGDVGTPAHGWASGERIRLLAARGELDAAVRALDAYERHYSGRPEFPILALAVSDEHVRGGRLDEASAILERVPAAGLDAATLARLSSSRGFLALYAGRYDAARAELEVAAAVMTGERRGEVLRVLGFLRAANLRELEALATAHRAAAEGRQGEALRRLLDGLERSPASAARPALLLWAGDLALVAGDVEAAEEVLSTIPHLYPDSGEAPVALIRLAEALAAVDRQTAAIELLETLILDYPDSALTPLGRRRLAELKQEVPSS